MQNIFMHIDNLLDEAKQAEIDDNAEDAYFYHIQISNYYKRIGNDAMSKVHKAKAEVYKDEDEQPKMRFL